MRIEDRFRVNVPIEDAWRILLDIERIAPCLPGAQLQEVEGDEYRGVVKVKVGPITAQYKGTATFEEVDEAARTIAIRATGRDTRGQGNASASIMVMMQADGDATDVSIDSDLSITGKVAQFGRGVLADVSRKLLGQFVENLERDVLLAVEVDLTAEESPSPAAEPHGNGAVRRIDSPEAQPFDLLDAAGASTAQRVVPVVAVLVGLYLIWRVLRRR